MNKTKQTLRLVCIGFTMGLADLVPGVSGGTIAFLFGVYDELLFSIKQVTGSFIRHLLNRSFKKAIATIPFKFLVPLFLGLLTAVFSLASVIEYLLLTFPVYLWSIFFGLVLGSAYVVSKRMTGWTKYRVYLGLAGFLVTFLLLGVSGSSDQDVSYVASFATGGAASSAMILPGISGSLLMVILGQYDNVIGFVTNRDFLQLAVFATGAILGLAVFSRLLSRLLHKHHSATIATLIGVMLGSLRRLWPWQSGSDLTAPSNYVPSLSVATTMAVVCVVLGFWIVWYVEKLGFAKESNDISNPEFTKEVRTQHD